MSEGRVRELEEACDRLAKLVRDVNADAGEAGYSEAEIEEYIREALVGLPE